MGPGYLEAKLRVLGQLECVISVSPSKQQEKTARSSSVCFNDLIPVKPLDQDRDPGHTQSPCGCFTNTGLKITAAEICHSLASGKRADCPQLCHREWLLALTSLSQLVPACGTEWFCSIDRSSDLWHMK